MFHIAGGSEPSSAQVFVLFKDYHYNTRSTISQYIVQTPRAKVD